MRKHRVSKIVCCQKIHRFKKGVIQLYKIMTVNLGGTSTKLSLFEDEVLLKEGTMRHTDEELSACTDNDLEIAFRKLVAQKWIAENAVSLDKLDAVVVRVTNTGGLATRSGTYQITGKLRDSLVDIYKQSFPKAVHPSILAHMLAESLIEGLDIPIFVVDPEDVNEIQEVAKITGHPDFPRGRMETGYHVLNHKAVARQAAKDMGKTYHDVNFVVAHLGGGVSIAAHMNGMVIDTTSGGPGGEGPFAINRSGSLPLYPLIEACFSGKYQKKDLLKIVMATGGFFAHTGLTDFRLIEQKAAEGDEKCDLLIRAFIYQVCRYIGAQYTVLNCNCDGIILTGGIAYSKHVVEGIRRCVGKLAPVLVYPGEEESTAMVTGALRILRGEEALVEL